MTVGRKTGKEREAIVAYFEDGPNIVTMAMNGWGEGEPAWWLNLLDHPDAEIELKGEAPDTCGSRPSRHGRGTRPAVGCLARLHAPPRCLRDPPLDRDARSSSSSRVSIEARVVEPAYHPAIEHAPGDVDGQDDRGGGVGLPGGRQSAVHVRDCSAGWATPRGTDVERGRRPGDRLHDRGDDGQGGEPAGRRSRRGRGPGS